MRGRQTRYWRGGSSEVCSSDLSSSSPRPGHRPFRKPLPRPEEDEVSRRMVSVLIAPRVEVLDLKMDLFGSVVHPTLVWDESEAVLIDAGYPGLLEQLREQAERAGVSAERLTRLIITHQDIDHIGGANAILALNPQIEVLAHADDRPYILGEIPLIKFSPERLAQVTELTSKLPEARRRETLEGFTHP